MAGILIQLISAATLTGALVYLAFLVFREIRGLALADAMAVAEREVLQLRIGEIAERRKVARSIEAASWQGFRKFEVKRKVQEGGGVCSFYLQPHDRRKLPSFQPGQYLTFNLQLPDQQKPVVRCYSLSDSPKDDYFRISVKRLGPPPNNPDVPPGLISNFLHENVNEGDILNVKAPGGHFYLDTTRSSPVVLIGGGVGITPVLSMLNQIVESGSNRETWFFYGVRFGEEHVMKEHLARIAEEHENVNLCVVYSDPKDEDRLGEDFHHKGWVSVDLFKEKLPSNNYDFYFCGPPPMMNALFEGLRDWDVPEDRIHYEAFGPATVKKKHEADATAEPETKVSAATVNVTFAKTGKTVQWSDDQGSLLELAEAHSIAMDSGCRAGNCGTCVTAIKTGKVDYLSAPGSEPEAGSCLACIAVPKGDLTLDA